MRRPPGWLVVALLALLPAAAGADRGALEIRGLELRERSWTQVERAALGAPPEELRAYTSRAGAWLIVADSKADWDAHVAPVLRDHLGSGGDPRALADALGELPSSVTVSGPDADGGLVRFDLPGERGRAYVGVALPRLLKRGRDAAGVLNSKRPNVGLFVAGADVRSEDRDATSDERLVALYVPSRPKPLTSGALPSVEARALPGKGRGALGVFGGRGGSGEDAELIVRDLKKFVGRDFLDAEMMRGFPKQGDLFGALRTIRRKGEVLVRDDDWYRTLANDPGTWTFESGSNKHPARYLATSAPLVAVVDDGGPRPRTAVVGIVALYTPLLLTPDEAPAQAGVGARAFYEAVQAGELPFLRVESEVYFYRPWVDRWAAGQGRRPGGRAMTYRDARKRAFAYADKLRSRSLDKAARGPLPFRMVAIPEDEREDLVDRRRAYRGRVHEDDLVAWLAHFDGDLDAEPAWTIAGRGDVAKVRTAWGGDDRAAGDAGTAVAAAGGTGKKAPRAQTADRLEDLGLGGDRGWESSDETEAEDALAELDVDLDSESDFDFDDLGTGGEPVPIGTGSWEEYGVETRGGGGGGPASLTSLEIREMYVGSCRPGDPLDAAVEFVLEGPGEGEVADLVVEWDFYLGGRNLKRDSSTVAREAGAQEIELDVTCPEASGSAELQVLLRWPDRELEAEGAAPVSVRGAARRTYAKLTMPSPKKCLTGVVGGEAGSDDGVGIQLAQGLDAAQISSAVRGFQEQTLRCHPEGGGVTGQVVLEISVGCDGRVKAADVIDDDVGDAEFAQCVADTMKYAPFDAHARDEVIFVQSLRYE